MKKLDVAGIGMTSQRTRERLIRRLQQEGIRDERVLEVMREVPRHLFVDEALSHRAYEDTALPIGYSQTLSQPYIVAKMTEALRQSGPLEKVLEIGTGSGYQTIILSQLCSQVFSVERIKSLQRKAEQKLRQLSVRNVRFRYGDGFEGWPGYAPYDGIIVTAAPEDVPEKLIDQLADGGRMVIPIGQSYEQQLVLLTKTSTGITQRMLAPVRFVPLLPGAV